MNTLLPKVAVLITSFQGEDFIEEQCATILNQVGVDVTLFFSDDCSTDFTLEKINNVCSQNSNCNILNTSKKFGTACENFLYLILNTPLHEFNFISFADQDDVWFPNKLKRAIEVLNAERSSGYSSDILSWDPEKHQYKRIIKHGNQTRYDYMFQGPGPGCTFVLNSHNAVELANFIKRMPESDRKQIWFHDWFIYAYFRANNKKWSIDSCIGMLYRQHSSNVIGSNIGIKGIIDRVNMLKKWRNQTIILAKIIGYYSNLPIKQFKKSGFYLITTPFRSRRKLSHSILLFLSSIFRIF